MVPTIPATAAQLLEPLFLSSVGEGETLVGLESGPLGDSFRDTHFSGSPASDMYRPGLAHAVERWVKTGREILGF